MTDQEFDAIILQRSEKTRAVLASKAGEYARGDRLSNFKRAAGAMDTTPEGACVAFWMKHVISIVDLVNDLKQGKVATPAMWDEKIGDATNYLVLLDGLVRERLHAANGTE